MTEHSYEEGVRDGRISALEKMMAEERRLNHSRFDNHDRRISLLEKIAYGAAGITVFLQLLPIIEKLISKGG